MSDREAGALESPACPLCGSSETDALYVARDRLLGRPGAFPVVRCAGCRLVFLKPRPAASELGAYYPEAYYPLDERPSPEAHSVAEGLLTLVSKWTREQGLPEPRILDVGCGTGLFLHLAQQRGMRVRGIELSEPAARYGRATFGLDIESGTLEHAELPDDAFDVVTMWHVLEHLPDPVEALRRVVRALAPGGLLLVAVPNFGGLEAHVFGCRWYSLDAPRHLYHFTPEALQAALSAAGLETQRIIHSSGTAGLVYSLMGDLTGVSLKVRGRPLADATYRRVSAILEHVVKPACIGAARLKRGGALEVYATRPRHDCRVASGT